MHAALRVLQAKLRMNHGELRQARIQALYRFTNSMPEGRSDSGVEKEHYVVGVKLSRTAQIGVNKEVLSNINFATTPGHLEALLYEVARQRPVKYGATMRAIETAKALHMLPWVTAPAQVPELVH